MEGWACLEGEGVVVVVVVGLVWLNVNALDFWEVEANINLVLEGLTGVEDCAIASRLRGKWMWECL